MGWLWRKKNKNKKLELERGAKLLEELIECCDGKSNPIKFFSADEILKATNDFSDSNLVHQEEFYCQWYSGKNENHPMILIRKGTSWWNRLRVDSLLCRDIAVSSMVSGHKNFLKLVGCCLELEYPITVYHGVKKHYQLEINEKPWKRRMKIAEDIATALAYLHTAFPRPFVYRSFSHQNILLDEDGVAKLTDFSFCVSIPEGETFVRVNRLAGTVDYFDPKYALHGVVSETTDVFAFGIFLQRLLMWETNKRFLFRVLRFKEEQRMDKIVDPKMLEKMGQISEEERCQMNAFLMLSLRCMGYKREVPTMVEVAKELKKIQRSLFNSTLLLETQFDSAQDISSRVVLSNQT
ncbi:unnamed protein product [Arabidopsis thaliana]|uniref:(thale cress) hypothetical protein n=1 Tax=Arabidopsis thaliana TaxID=3702 RepID=A0A7G2E2W2_ARATH|nr:unnamed protein product [Arabidopsis thaliana]